jgi:hypothetical protein
MENKASLARRYLEHMLVDETAEPKDMPVSLLEEITDGFSVDREIGRGGFAVVYKVYIYDTRLQILLVALDFKTQTNANTSECQEILGTRGGRREDFD